VNSDAPKSEPEDKRELLEIYKLHAELADRVSRRREGANRLFVTLLTGIFIFFGAVARFGTGEFSFWLILLFGGIFGMMLCVAWYIVTRSYRQLNTGKFEALHEIEERLTYPFFKREWELLERGRDFRRYWKLTVVENFLPAILFILLAFIAWAAFNNLPSGAIPG